MVTAASYMSEMNKMPISVLRTSFVITGSHRFCNIDTKLATDKLTEVSKQEYDKPANHTKIR